MRSTTRFATALGITLGLGLIVVPQMAAAQAGAAFQDQGIREEIGDLTFGARSATAQQSAQQSYAQETSKSGRAATQKRSRTTAHKRQHEASATQARASSQQPASANVSGLPGHSARPEGMCWMREVGAGTDITGGYWAACPKTH